MGWPKGRPRSEDERERIAAGMRKTGGKRRSIVLIGDGTAHVPLTRGAVAVIDAADIPLVANRTWHLHSAGYAVARRLDYGKYQTIYMHRVLLPVVAPLEVDHINGNRLDNRRSNLRSVTVTLQRANAGPRRVSASRYRGVSVARGVAHPWTARIRGKTLGAFATEEEAARAADAEMLRLYGPYARLNFSEDNDAAA
jgi:hypothetical protein